MYDANLASGANVPVACYQTAALCADSVPAYLYLSDELGSPVCISSRTDNLIGEGCAGFGDGPAYGRAEDDFPNCADIRRIDS
jgi:hypothetical protein